MTKTLYKETQSMYFITGLLVACAVFMVLGGLFQWGSKPIPLLWGIIFGLIFILLSLLFYRMRILITETHASVSFGIGLIKRVIKIEDLHLETAEIVHLPWYSGVGYRISPRGTFFNTRPGPAVFIKTKNGLNEFFVGTKNGAAILTILKKEQQNS